MFTITPLQDRLAEILQKWSAYKELLDSAHDYLTNDFPDWLAHAEKNMPDSLDQAQRQREETQAELEKLYAMKRDLSAAVHLCENLGSSEQLDKADQGVDSPVSRFAEQVNSEMETCINQVSLFISHNR